MALKIVEAERPKGTSGRKSVPISTELADALVAAFTDKMVGDSGRERMLGDGADFDTRGKASNMGRKYADYVSEKLGKVVRVNVYNDDTANQDAKPFHWRIYIPLSEQGTASQPEPAAE